MAAETLDDQLRETLFMLQENEKQFILVFIKSYLKRKDSQRISTEQFNNKLHEVITHMESGKAYAIEEMEVIADNW